MNKKTILVLTISVFLGQMNFINCLKCKIGYGLSPKSSDPIAYNYDNTSPQNECPGTGLDNPLLQPIGCYKFVHKLSDGNEFVEKGCFTAAKAATAATSLYTSSYSYDGKVFAYVCKTDNCNSSANFKISISLVLSVLLISILNFF
ncbi:unnamed protein product [Brachionus calyciflorus]|uniref:Activin types I and II receptor domain-containing protein n=1 Tax=Brachionus calyciflorus TaxID=104777 RepID=A0A813WVD2_9BILA|nr:unnamed protein product [Brachionus calyciflorus]